MGYDTSRYNYVHGKNLATMTDRSLAGNTKSTKGSKVTDSGVYEIEFSYSVSKGNTIADTDPHFYIGFGVFVSDTTTAIANKALVRLGADNTASQAYSNQRAVKVWVTKTDNTELDFMGALETSLTTWSIYNINAVAKKIADI